ncbi:hypothetical protein AB0L75_40590 [Streptomyces sp. NPDC052101]|uniref:hypothetical protein n=1 Tax=Streptomyces sp. NPDC052101 TaxID=3155763 RepID=UPI00342C343C
MTPGLAHELRIGDRRVALDALPDVAVSRSFSEFDADAPREHHIRELDSFDFVVRVPTGELHGADPATLTFSLVCVTGHRGGASGLARLEDDPELGVTPMATLADVSAADLPTSLRRILESD